MILDYMLNNTGLVIEKLIQHMQITLIAVLFAVVVGVPLGIIVSRSEKLGKIILGVANIFQTIPSLALFGFIIPLPIIGGIGYKPAVIVLFLYALLPIIKNTYIGIKSVDDAVIESAKGMGMTARQILLMVTLPLAFPIIMGGIRVATVINIGTATIAALIGAGGLGDFIFRGISMSDTGIILAGAIPTTVLALSIDFILGLIENKLPVSALGHVITNKKIMKRALVCILIPIIAIGSITYIRSTKSEETIVIGTKNFTESRLMGELLSVYIENNTNLKTKVSELGGTLPAFKAIQSKDIDMYVEYTGTGYVTLLKKQGDIPSSQEVYDIVKKEFDEQFGLSWLNPLGFNNTYTLAVKKGIAEKYNLNTFSDLAQYSNEFILGPTPEILERPDGFPGLKELYDFSFKDIKALDPGLRYNAIADNSVQVTDAFSTDGKIQELGLVVLEDDKEYFPPYYAVPLVNNRTLEENSELKPLLQKLGNVLDDEQMQKLNYRADVKKEDLRDIATDFLKSTDLIK
ncbi:glycine betaine ABC transporter substrate-binding protein [Tepidibacter mesophilus]|uniref:glycine betaine ABC transporter substrate-binding protein n=1 Tax=Tepidibacter mesophilus TaxID=655607 RepID=UPI000C06E01C|nr:glycine betaine ABC transporter substrate-binding protein [Tepidibacter mesophilus]